eukprot:CAMPEP_0194712786 /NCGR_PEP_ID=MMETSP0296-20130528/4795_1 /TAXON_ID=39354 /ORGANISM="Heterosigma akashiwo, Strain CCMP2393" /LENGTH=112 /DNA_ID=CAMNT_0039611313 /DNA_START=47 /DNA_END=381 /DNA_ORIENTATION=-
MTPSRLLTTTAVLPKLGGQGDGVPRGLPMALPALVIAGRFTGWGEAGMGRGGSAGELAPRGTALAPRPRHQPGPRARRHLPFLGVRGGGGGLMAGPALGPRRELEAAAGGRG